MVKVAELEAEQEHPAPCAYPIDHRGDFVQVDSRVPGTSHDQPGQRRKSRRHEILRTVQGTKRRSAG
jgi:hypothetical protein